MEPEVNSEMAESFLNESFNIDEFTDRMAFKLIKYGEPNKSFINYERTTFTGASKKVEYTPYCKVTT